MSPLLKVLPAQIQAAYDMARRVYDPGRQAALPMEEAVEQLTALGLNKSTAWTFVTTFRHLRMGSRYTWGLSQQATDSYLTWIHRDYGAAGLAMALQAVEGHIKHREARRNGAQKGMREVLMRHRARLAEGG